MAYEKQNFNNGIVLTAAQLNHIENGIVEVSEKTDKLSSEIADFTVEGEVPINICNELYEYGRFGGDGYELNDAGVGALRSVNYLKVIGGKTIKAIMGQNAKFNANSALQIIQYNSKLEVVGQRTEIYATKSNGNVSSKTPQELTLNNETAYIRFGVCNWSDVGALEDAQIGLYYVDDNIQDYLPYSETKTETFLNTEKLNGFSELSNGNRKMFSSIKTLRTSSDFSVGDVLETFGYYEDGDGGGAVYNVVDTLDSTTHQIALGNGLYASLVHNGEINVKQLGACGDNLTDDSQALQKAFDLATKAVYIPKGEYLTKSTVVVQNKKCFIVHAEESTIRFTKQGEYCFKFTNMQHCEFHFGEVVGKNSNGCIELYADGLDTAVAYIDIYFKLFCADTNCVYAHCGANGTYICEIRFFNGRLSAYSGHGYGVGLKIDNRNMNTMDHYVLTNVGVEGIHTGFYFIGTEEQLGTSTKGVIEACEFIGCRMMESFTYVLKTEGVVRNCHFVGASYMYSSYFDVSEKTRGIMLHHPIHEKLGARVAYSAIIHEGVLVPHMEDSKVYNNITPIADYDLNTDTDLFNRVYKYFLVNGNNKSLKLTNQYGKRFGHNKFYLKFDSISSNGFTLYDYEGNAIFTTPSTLQAPCLLSFEWMETVGWIITKVDTVV